MNRPDLPRTPLQRAFYGSALKRKKCAALVLVVAGLLMYWAAPAFMKYYFKAPLELLAGSLLGCLFYLPTLFALAFLVRCRRIPQLFFWLAGLSVFLFFGPLTSQTNHFFQEIGVRRTHFVGFSEETWKIMPLVLIMLFARPLIRGVREGVLFGALGGFGFACLEMGAYFALDEFVHNGWSGFFSTSLARATVLGTDIHIVWSAFLGGAFAYALVAEKRWQRILFPLVGYLLVVITHNLQDGALGKIITALFFMAISPLFTALGLTEETLTPFLIPLDMASATFNLLVINIVLLPLLITMLWHGRKMEQETLVRFLQDEQPPVILDEEKKGLRGRKIFHRRKIGSDSPSDRTIVQAQNELALRREQLARKGSPNSEDGIIVSLVKEISDLRAAS